MSRRLVTISYTGLDAPGGVPKFNRDLHAAFPERERAHFCWHDYPHHDRVDMRGETEWGRAAILNGYLLQARLIGPEDIVVADGFWASRLEPLRLAISHCHGIWSHLTQRDVLLGKTPDMPHHHFAQVKFRQNWSRLQKPMTSVSAFITEQLRQQWGILVDRTINNGVDTDVYRPAETMVMFDHTLVIHGVNDRGNMNKGGDHIALLERELTDSWVLSLDEAQRLLEEKTGRSWTKAEALAQADIFVHPSGFEGNSMMVAEALSCGLPFVGYDVGLMWWLRCSLPWERRVGFILPSEIRLPAETLYWVRYLLHLEREREEMRRNARQVALEQCAMSVFQERWREYLECLERSVDA